jgi:predicted ATPase/DNA-binding SARP family transcriptional activator
MLVEIRTLGGFDVTVDGVQVRPEAWLRRQAAVLVKLLAITPGHRLHREQVIDALWPDLAIDKAAPRLHKCAHFARAATGARQAIVIADEFVALFPSEQLVVDVDQFVELADRGRSSAIDDIERALAVYRGDLLPDDLYEPWTEEPRQRLRLRRLGLLREAGRWEELVAADPTDEDAHLRLVHARLAAADRAGALRQLDWMEASLRRSLDLDPSEAAIALRADALALPVDGAAGAPRRSVPPPRPATPTIGREVEIDEVTRLLERSPVVTLLGPGGVGKTRLATEVATRAGEDTTEACFVDLTRVREPALVPELIVGDLGIRVGVDVDPVAALEDRLRGRRVLVVLDNFEHVISAAPIVVELTRRCPDLRVLATSRARLRVSGEVVFDVEPLGTDVRSDGSSDAVRLFAQAARAVDLSFDLAAHVDEVTAICRTIDGLPLAIELAAGHIRTLPPALLRARLGARLASPDAAARNAPARQQTIPATIDWSLQLLAPAERRLFVNLGVFDSAVALDAIEQVCAEPGVDTIDVLGRLVDQSLVRRTAGVGGEPRYGLLELLRERARQLTVDHDEIRRRHAAYVGAFLEGLDDRRWRETADRWIDLTSEMLAEIRAAHAWACATGDVVLGARITAALGRFWFREGHHAEARRWVAEVLMHVDLLDDGLAARVALAAGLIAWPNDAEAAFEHWDRAAKAFRRVGDDRNHAYAVALSARPFIGDRQRYDWALKRCDEGISLARQVGEPLLIAQALNMRGELSRVHGDDEVARVAYEEGRDLAIAAGDDAHLSVFLLNLSYLADHRGEYEESRKLCCDSLRLCRALGRRMMAAWRVSELAGPEVGLGRPERGALLVGASDEALRALGVGRHPGDRPEHERVVAALHAALGDERAEALRREGATLSLDQAIELALSEPSATTT